MLNRCLLPALSLLACLAFVVPARAQTMPDPTQTQILATLQAMQKSLDTIAAGSGTKSTTPSTPAPSNYQILAAIYPCQPSCCYPCYATCLAPGDTQAGYMLVAAKVLAQTPAAPPGKTQTADLPALNTYTSASLAEAAAKTKIIDGLKKSVTYKVDAKSYTLYVTGSAADLKAITDALNAAQPPAITAQFVAGTNEAEAKEMSANIKQLAVVFSLKSINVVTRANTVYVYGTSTDSATLKQQFEKVYPQKFAPLK